MHKKVFFVYEYLNIIQRSFLSENPSIGLNLFVGQIHSNKKVIGFKTSAMVRVISLIARLLMRLLNESRKSQLSHMFPQAREQIDQQKISWSPICGVEHLLNFAQ